MPVVDLTLVVLGSLEHLLPVVCDAMVLEVVSLAVLGRHVRDLGFPPRGGLVEAVQFLVHVHFLVGDCLVNKTKEFAIKFEELTSVLLHLLLDAEKNLRPVIYLAPVLLHLNSEFLELLLALALNLLLLMAVQAFENVVLDSELKLEE